MRCKTDSTPQIANESLEFEKAIGKYGNDRDCAVIKILAFQIKMRCDFLMDAYEMDHNASAFHHVIRSPFLSVFPIQIQKASSFPQGLSL